MPITLDELKADFATWCATYAFLQDPNTELVMTFSVDTDVYTITKWEHSSNKPSLQLLQSTLSQAAKETYNAMYKYTEFMTQANPILRSGYVMLWQKVRALEGTTLTTPEEVLDDLRTAMVQALTQ
jgi:hypothetical protein